jgi:hypothetical protein
VFLPLFLTSPQGGELLPLLLDDTPVGKDSAPSLWLEATRGLRRDTRKLGRRGRSRSRLKSRIGCRSYGSRGLLVDRLCVVRIDLIQIGRYRLWRDRRLLNTHVSGHSRRRKLIGPLRLTQSRVGCSRLLRGLLCLPLFPSPGSGCWLRVGANLLLRRTLVEPSAGLELALGLPSLHAFTNGVEDGAVSGTLGAVALELGPDVLEPLAEIATLPVLTRSEGTLLLWTLSTSAELALHPPTL